jgi:predicted amidohydrolase
MRVTAIQLEMTDQPKEKNVEHDAGQLFNTSIFLNPNGDIAAHYRKIHLFGYQSEEAALLASRGHPALSPANRDLTFIPSYPIIRRISP